MKTMELLVTTLDVDYIRIEYKDPTFGSIVIDARDSDSIKHIILDIIRSIVERKESLMVKEFFGGDK